jgi:chemotaxis protein MotB
MSRKKRGESSGPGAPAWIVTFSDMITLLLTFFVMLMSMAETQVVKEKFEAGQESFQRALASFGLSGFLVSQKSGPDFDHPKPMYRVDEGQDEPEDRSVDAQTEMLRRILLEIEERMKISPSQINGVSRTFLSTPIRFAPGSRRLDADHKRQLMQHWQQIRSGLTDTKAVLYVLGLANDVEEYDRQMILSAQRAQAVADYLLSIQTGEMRFPVYCWGAGAGGDWTGKKGLTNPSTQIVIAVLIETR